MKFLIAICAVILVVGGAVIYFMNEGTVHEGYKEIEFDTDDRMVLVVHSDALVEAVSCKYFFLESTGKPIIEAIERKPPLQWPCDKYFLIKNISISKGQWEVQEGRVITISFKNENNIIVSERLNERFFQLGAMATSFFAVGVCVLIIVAYKKQKSGVL